MKEPIPEISWEAGNRKKSGDTSEIGEECGMMSMTNEDTVEWIIHLNRYEGMHDAQNKREG